MLLVLAALVGVLVGIVSGITPGIHVNLICSILLAIFPLLPFSGTDAVVFIISVAITHSFLDAIPSIFLGAPDASTALGVLPGHRYLLKGNGFMAVKLFTLGALAGLLLGFITYPLFMQFTILTEKVPKYIVGYILLAVPLIMWLRDKKKLAAGAIIILASCFGFIGFSFPDPLFPMLSGLFGAATLMYSLFEKTTLPEQKVLTYTEVRWRDAIRASVGGLIAGGLTAILPGVSAAHASALGMVLAAGTGDHGYLVLVGAIGMTNFFLSLAAYSAIQKARNGALLAATTIQPQIPFIAAAGAALLAGGLGVLLTLWIGRVASKWMSILPYQKLTIGVLAFATGLVVIISGWQGLLLYITGAAIGVIPAASKAARSHSMSCILIPVAWRFIVG